MGAGLGIGPRRAAHGTPWSREPRCTSRRLPSTSVRLAAAAARRREAASRYAASPVTRWSSAALLIRMPWLYDMPGTPAPRAVTPHQHA